MQTADIAQNNNNDAATNVVTTSIFDIVSDEIRQNDRKKTEKKIDRPILVFESDKIVKTRIFWNFCGIVKQETRQDKRTTSW